MFSYYRMCSLTVHIHVYTADDTTNTSRIVIGLFGEVLTCCGCMCAMVGVCVLWVYVCCGCMCAVVGVCVKKQESSVNTNKV